MDSQEPKITNPQGINTSYLVRAKATYYPDFVSIWIPNEPYEKINTDYERLKSSIVIMPRSDEIGDPIDKYETDVERSIRRTRKRVKDYVIYNDFELFVTFTFTKDRQNEKSSRKRLSTWLRNQRTRNGRFLYLAVPEYHKDGALHFHVLIGSYKGDMELAVNPHTGKQITDRRRNPVYTLTGYTLGFNNVKIIDSSEGKTKTAYYIQKYITKDAISDDGRQRYWASKNLKLPKTEDNPEDFYKHVIVNRQFVNDHGTVLEIDKGISPLSDMFIEANN